MLAAKKLCSKIINSPPGDSQVKVILKKCVSPRKKVSHVFETTLCTLVCSTEND